MKHLLIIRPEAERDLSDARDWYDEQRAGLGMEFLTAIDEVVERIRDNPRLYAAEYKSVRRCGLRRFPFVVYYRIVDVNVEIFAVQQGSRSARHWRSRI